MASSSISIRALIVLAVLTLCTWCVSATNTCYFPDGDVASKFVPCSPNGDGGCCGSGDFCTSLGYCISNSKGYHYRGACTDSTWFNPSCPNYCLTNANSGNSTSVNVIACNAATTGGSWCCSYNNTNCCGTDSVYVPTFGTIFAGPGTSSTSSAAAASGTKASSPASSASLTTASPASQASTSSVADSTMKRSSNTGTVVGAAVGIPLGLVAVAAMVLYFRERRKRRNVGPEVPEKSEPYGYYNGSVPTPTFNQVPVPTNRNFGSNESTSDGKMYELSSQRAHELPTPQ